jgi:hypothetical protein
VTTKLDANKALLRIGDIVGVTDDVLSIFTYINPPKDYGLPQRAEEWIGSHPKMYRAFVDRLFSDIDNGNYTSVAIVREGMRETGEVFQGEMNEGDQFRIPNYCVNYIAHKLNHEYPERRLRESLKIYEDVTWLKPWEDVNGVPDWYNKEHQ